MTSRHGSSKKPSSPQYAPSIESAGKAWPQQEQRGGHEGERRSEPEPRLLREPAVEGQLALCSIGQRRDALA